MIKKKWLRRKGNSLLVVWIICPFISLAQDFNKDFNKSFINHTTPKSPESASIERYGVTPVSESTGTPNISIPLYTVTGSSLSSPVQLTYHPSGIRVNQEATWVGLGWDIRAGGRITLDIKGGYDRYTRQYLHSWTRSSIAYIFQNFTSASNFNNLVYAGNPCNWTPATIENYLNNNVFPCSIPRPDSLFDIQQSTYQEDIHLIRTKGIAEPDLYTADFLGNSFTFYRDLLTDSIRLKGEKNLFKVKEIDLSTWSSRFEIIDESGITYVFSKEEKTYYQPQLEGIIPSATTAWLLTDVLHLNGDRITYSYSNYGKVFPAPGISESQTLEEGVYTSYSNQLGMTPGGAEILQEPQYLTSIETKNTRVDFELGSRKDIAGDGIRQLNKIVVTNLVTNDIVKQIKFNYDYFNGMSGGYIHFDTTIFRYGTPGPENTALNHISLRLKLNSIDVFANDSNSAQTHKFFYNNPSGLPHKISFSQDHWSLYNGANIGVFTSNQRFTPSAALLASEGVLPSIHTSTLVTSPPTINLSQVLPGNVDRRANQTYAVTGMLDSIVYPTGGSSMFEYELHQSDYSPKTNGPLLGGGLRIKTIRTYPDFNAAPTTETYEYKTEGNYTSGVYMGNIDYYQLNVKQLWRLISGGDPNATGDYQSYYDFAITLFSSGVLQSEGPNVLYSRVVKKTNGGSEGWIEKKFEVSAPYHQPNIVTGFPVSEHSRLSPANNPDVRGNLLSESIYDKNNVLKKSTHYYYNPLTTSSHFYSLKASSYNFPAPGYPVQIVTSGGTLFYFHPASIYRTLVDSVVEVSKENGLSLITKTENRYNQYGQLEWTATTNSKKEKLILQTRTPLSFENIPDNETNVIRDALVIQNLRKNNNLNLPIERLLIRKTPTSDSILLRASYNLYDINGNIRKTYLLEQVQPTLLTAFQRASYNGSISGYNILRDAKYTLKESADYITELIVTSGAEPHKYSPTSFLGEVTNASSVTAMIWDTLQNSIIAQSENARQSDIAYTSFEKGSNLSWVVTGTPVANSTAPMGAQVLNLSQSSAQLIKNGLKATTVYIITYWSDNSSGLSIIGSQSGSPRKLSSLNGWHLFEHKVTGQTSIAISGSGLIDEVRLFPSGSRMVSYNYYPGIGIKSEADVNGRITYYEYDNSNRLQLIRDQQKNILKRFNYKYSGQKINFDGQKYLSNVKTKWFTKNSCASGTPERVLYIVPEGKYNSTTSQDAADLLAQADIDANGQAYANSIGRCQFFSQYQEQTFTQNNCASGYIGATITYRVQAGAYLSFDGQAQANAMAAAEIAANGQTLANQGTCALAIPLDCPSGVPEAFSVTFHNTSTGVDYSFTITGTGNFGQIPAGTYTVRINPQSYSQAYTYIINGDYYSSGEISPEFTNITFSDPYNSTISIYW